MSDLIAIAYPDQQAVERARENLRQAVTDDLIQVEDVVVLIRKEDGAFEARQGSSGVGAMAVGGGMFGGAIGTIFLAPLLGMALGALAAGAAWKAVTGDPGVAENFIDELKEHLEPGQAVLVVLIRKMELDQVLARLEEPGHVIRTSLSKEIESQLNEVFGQTGK